MKLDIYSPTTQQPTSLELAEHAAEHAEKTGKRLDRRRLSEYGYITYLRDPHLHTNTAASYPGFGQTPEESYANARYWANQAPWVVTVPFNRAPRWAQEASRDSEGSS